MSAFALFSIIRVRKQSIPSAILFGAINGISTYFVGLCMYVGTFKAEMVKMGVVTVATQSQRRISSRLGFGGASYCGL